MGISNDINRDYFGDQSGRSVSVRMGDGLTRVTGGVVSQPWATHVVHASMGGMAALKATEKIGWETFIVGSGMVGALLWYLGNRPPSGE